MRIAFNPSTVAALTAPPDNKDITFDLRGRNIFARGVKFCGTDTNTWRDIKINNVSIDSNILDLRDGDNTTLTNINGIVTINSTWRPVVDNLTSDSTTSSLSANQGRVLAELINTLDTNISSQYALRDGSNATGRWRGGLACLDVRDTNYTPYDLNMGLELHFFRNTTNNLKDGGEYNGVFSFRQWVSGSDWSGGKAHQLSFTDNGNIWHRTSSGDDSWGTWKKLAYSTDIPNSLKNPYALTISLNGTSQGPYDGSAVKNINITPSSIGAATSGHTHDGRYLRWNGSTADISAMGWGTLTAANGYTILSHAASSDGGDMGFVNKGGQIFMQLDGYYYQKEGQYRVLDTSDFTTFSNIGSQTTRITIGGVTKDLKIDADTVDGIDSTGFGYNKTSANYDLNEVGTHFAAYRHSDAPSNTFSNSAYGNTLVIGAGSDTMTQIGGPYYLQELYFRNGTWYRNGTGSIRTQGWNRILHSSNYTDYTVKKDGTGANGTWGINITGSAGSVAWGNVSGKPNTFTPSSHTHSYITAKDNYTFNSSTLPNSFDYGVSAGFVDSDSGFGSYGSVLTVRTYSGGGGTLQLYAPYSNTYGGSHLKARFGNYESSSGNSWTALKTIAWTDDIPSTMAWTSITGKPSSFTPASHNHSFTLGATTITTGETRTAINGPFAIYTYESAGKAFSICREGVNEGVKHWVDDSMYHIEYTNDEATSSIAIRLINTDIERATNKGADAKDVTVYLDCDKNFYPSSNNTGNIGISIRKWANMYASTFHGSLDGNATTATNSDTLDGYHASGLLTALSNSDNGISITVGGITKSISNISVNYASSAGNADTLDGYHASSDNNKPWGTIPVITTQGYMDIGIDLEFHCDNSTGSDYSTALMCQGNYNNIVYLPSASGTLALTSDNVASATNAYHLRINSANTWSTWYWTGQDGQPSWLWGSNDGTNMYVWDPNNFNVHTAQYLRSLGNQNCQTGRTQNYGDVYSYNTYDGNTGSPTTYSSVIGFGRGIGGTVEIAGGWCNTHLYWRSLRDCCDDWYSWRTVLDSSNYTGYVDNYYWANVKISTSSSTTTSPTVSSLTATSSIKVCNISLGNGNEINSANGGLYLNYGSSDNISLCQGGGNVGIGTTTPSYKLDVNGQMRASGFIHSDYSINDAVLLAGGGYGRIFMMGTTRYYNNTSYDLSFHKLSSLCNSLVWVDGCIWNSTSTSFYVSSDYYPYLYANSPSMRTIYRMDGNNMITVDGNGLVVISCSSYPRRIGFFYTGRA